MRSIPRQVVRPAAEDGLSGSDDVPTVAADQAMDREGHRASTERSVYMAEPV